MVYKAGTIAVIKLLVNSGGKNTQFSYLSKSKDTAEVWSFYLFISPLFNQVG